MDIAGKVVITLTKSWLLIQATTSGLQVHFLEISGVHQINYGICALSYALDTDFAAREIECLWGSPQYREINSLTVDYLLM